MSVTEFTLLLSTTISCALCVGFMIFCTISWFRLERKIDYMREERRALRDEIDALRSRLKENERRFKDD